MTADAVGTPTAGTGPAADPAHRTAAAGSRDADAAARPGSGDVEDRVVLRLPDGVRLLGRYEGSGLLEPHFLAQRADGQMVHLSRLLYLVAANAEGGRSLDEVAARVSDQYQRVLTPAGLRFLVEEKLGPAGVVTAAGPGAEPLPDILRGSLAALRQQWGLVSASAAAGSPAGVLVGLLSIVLLVLPLLGVALLYEALARRGLRLAGRAAARLADVTTDLPTELPTARPTARPRGRAAWWTWDPVPPSGGRRRSAGGSRRRSAAAAAWWCCPARAAPARRPRP